MWQVLGSSILGLVQHPLGDTACTQLLQGQAGLGTGSLWKVLLGACR